MAKRDIKRDRTSVIMGVLAQDSSSTVGAGLSGLVYNSPSLAAYYWRNKASAPVAITLANMTLGTYTSGGFKEVHSTQAKGLYAFCPPNAALATGSDGSDAVYFFIYGATNLAPIRIEVSLTNTDDQDGSNGGLASVSATYGIVLALLGQTERAWVTSAVGGNENSITLYDPGVADLAELVGLRIRWTASATNSAVFERVVTGSSYDGDSNIICTFDEQLPSGEVPNDGDTAVLLFGRATPLDANRKPLGVDEATQAAYSAASNASDAQAAASSVVALLSMGGSYTIDSGGAGTSIGLYLPAQPNNFYKNALMQAAGSQERRIVTASSYNGGTDITTVTINRAFSSDLTGAEVQLLYGEWATPEQVEAARAAAAAAATAAGTAATQSTAAATSAGTAATNSAAAVSAATSAASSAGTAATNSAAAVSAAGAAATAAGAAQSAANTAATAAGAAATSAATAATQATAAKAGTDAILEALDDNGGPAANEVPIDHTFDDDLLPSYNDVVIEDVEIRAYVKSEYDAGVRTNLIGESETNTTGWVRPINLPFDDQYIIAFEKPGAFQVSTVVVTVDDEGNVEVG